MFIMPIIPSNPNSSFSLIGAGSFIIPYGVSSLSVVAVGGSGGDGGGSYLGSVGTSAYGGSGGGGATVTQTSLSVSPGDTVLVTIGQGGAGTGAAVANDKPNYGTSSTASAGTSTVVKINGVDAIVAGGGNGAVSGYVFWTDNSTTIRNGTGGTGSSTGSGGTITAGANGTATGGGYGTGSGGTGAAGSCSITW